MLYLLLQKILFWLIVSLPIILVALVIIIRIYNQFSVKFCTSTAQLHGKTVIITGASAGIGKEAARDFAARGARVILACRNRSKAQLVADDIIHTSGNKDVHVRILDTSLLSSVRAFAKDVMDKEERLDILVLNAGIGSFKEKRTTSEGLEVTMATNHFGHFLLVNLLSGLLRKTSPSRVVVTSSQMHSIVTKFNSKDLNFREEKYGPSMAYALSKLCNVMMTRYLAAYFQGKGVTVNCLCPGFVRTEIFDKATGFYIHTLSGSLVKLAGRTELEGAQTIIHLAVSEDVADVSGGFFIDLKERKPNRLAEDAGLIKKVWEESEDVVQLTPEERSARNNPAIL